MTAAPVVVPLVHLQNILFPTDFSDYSRRALPYATDLARKVGATLHLWHLVTPSELVMGAPEAAPERYEAEHRTMRKALQELRSSDEMRGIQTNTILIDGILKEELAKQIETNHIDLVVLSSHGRSGLRRLALGSVADVIFREATCPVLTVGPSDSGPESTMFRRILLPTDFSSHSTTVLPHILRIAQQYQSTVFILHALPAGTASEPADEARRTLQDMFAKAFGDLDAQFLIGYGHPGTAILTAAAENRCNLIAMGIKTALMPEIDLRSGTTDHVMAGAQCPVLTCR